MAEGKESMSVQYLAPGSLGKQRIKCK